MSLKDAIGKNYENLNKLLNPYIEALDDKEETLKLKGKRLEHANREQASWLSFYDERRIELATYVRFFEMEIKRVRSKLYRNYLEHHSRDLNDRTIEKYLDSEDAFLNVSEKYLAVKELYGQYESIVESFKARGYALNNITRIRVASLEDVVI